MPSEFSLIARHFTRPTRHTVLGVGDDCAIVAPSAGHELLVSSDMLVAGTHFLPDTDPLRLGWKTAAVNISDIAAMGGTPRWITLALSLPAADEAWIAALAQGFSECCTAFDVDWIGGDTTRGPLNLCATVFGEAPSGQAIRRGGARPGDEVWVSGWPGLAALGLRHLLDGIPLAEDWRAICVDALERPQPRVALGQSLRGIASAMLDVSDGLAGDLGHILNASACGAVLDEAALPLGPALAACNDAARARHCLLAGGDDYELVFTAPPSQRTALQAIAAAHGVPLTRIGACTAQTGLYLRAPDGRVEALAAQGFDHFA
ncbi:thiamine-phosphate kinase [Niveibacterium umoris]|uniref:Thiamine-monophosphate kinase n=1 Tax=Niveibacterium umoris TaxID=1193620 RepID=A0A840BNT1_9RHOO|nr:thiamine-phosphate kinase [Niveibacterium umoris]MBB4013198.1 thiamine-monophosphate kinase [Niveibacterium umoris]